MLGIYEDDIRESFSNGAFVSEIQNCNFSSEWSRLINEAGRWCESYASDILIDFESIKAYLERLASGEESESREFWFGFRQMGIDHLAFIQSRTEREYASHTYRAVWKWSFTVEEREYGPYIVSKLEKLLVI